MVIAKNPITAAELLKRYPQFFLEVIGDANRAIHGVSAPEAGFPDTAVFLGTPKALRQGLESQAAILVINKKSRAEAEAKRGNRTILLSSNAELAMAWVINDLFLKTPYLNSEFKGIHPTAVISEGVEFEPDVKIGPYAVIGRNVRLGKAVFIGANTVIEEGSSIAEGSVIHPLVYIGHSTEIGRYCEIHPHSVIGKEGFGYAHDEKFNHRRVPHQGRVVIEDDVHIGGCVTIDRSTFGETRIQFGAKLDNHIHIGHNCRIGRNSLITAGFLIGGSGKVGANFVTGGNTVVTGHIEVGDNIQLSALSAVGKSMDTPGQYGGSPLLPLQQHIKMKAAMVQLPKMRKQLSLIMKKLGLKDDETQVE